MLGKQIRHYRVLEQLGAGGMGVVYRALDTHLNRPVAIKVLPAELVSSPDRKKRFVQEARSASALNHPNIVTIYDIDSAEIDGHTVDYMAMEFVAGETLDKIIARGSARLKDKLKWACQLAGALTAAHATGIVHRDLKPSNAIITALGDVKLLDFGLAKLTEPELVDVTAPTEFLEPSRLATLSEEGLVVGTAAYMAPEQAEGKQVDARSDVFSLGVVLYELVSGHRPFSGGTKLALLSAILHKDPEPLDSADLPADLERAIERCLRKEPERRWQHVSDLRVALEEIREDVEAGRIRRAVPTGPTWIDKARKWAAPAAAGLLLGVLPGIWFGRAFFHHQPVSFQRLTFRRGDVSHARFAPDGSIVYSANWEGIAAVYSLRPGNRESRSLGLPPSTHLLAVSRSGEMAVQLAQRSTLARLPLSGGAPREIMEDVLEADWSPDSRSLAVVRRAGSTFRLEYPPGRLLHENQRRPQVWPRVSPDGNRIAFWDFDAEIGDYSLLLSEGGARPRILVRGYRGIAGLSWSPRGELWFSAVRPGGEPVLYAVDAGGRERTVLQATHWLSLHDIDAEGNLLAGDILSRVGIAGRPPGAPEERDLSWHDTSSVQQLLDDGTLLFVELAGGEGRNSAVYLRRPGAETVRLGDCNRPTLSPDGRLVLCIHRDQQQTSLQILPTGAGDLRTLPNDGFRYETAEWLPDGARILFTASRGGGPPRSYLVPLNGGSPLPACAEDETAARVSLDGARLIVNTSAGPRLRALAGGPLAPIPGLEPGDAVIQWAASNALFIQTRDADRVRVARIDLASGKRTALLDLRPPEPGDTIIGNVVLAAQGSAYAFSFQRDLANLFLIRGAR